MLPVNSPYIDKRVHPIAEPVTTHPPVSPKSSKADCDMNHATTAHTNGRRFIKTSLIFVRVVFSSKGPININRFKRMNCVKNVNPDDIDDKLKRIQIQIHE